VILILLDYKPQFGKLCTKIINWNIIKEHSHKARYQLTHSQAQSGSEAFAPVPWSFLTGQEPTHTGTVPLLAPTVFPYRRNEKWQQEHKRDG
jgi:hypothetical protein